MEDSVIQEYSPFLLAEMASNKSRSKYSFRFPPELAEQVEDYIAKVKITPTQFFAEAAIEKLSGHNLESLLEEIQTLKKEILINREELAIAAKGIMTERLLDGELPKETAERWVDDHLNQRRT